jgi:hypothetical protein
VDLNTKLLNAGNLKQAQTEITGSEPLKLSIQWRKTLIRWAWNGVSTTIKCGIYLTFLHGLLADGVQMQVETVCGTRALKNFISSITENSFSLCNSETFPGSLHCVTSKHNNYWHFIFDARNIWQEATKTPLQLSAYTCTKQGIQTAGKSHNTKMMPSQSHIITSLVRWGNCFISNGFLGLSTNGNKNLSPHPFMLRCVIFMQIIFVSYLQNLIRRFLNLLLLL